ncbi:MAG TPA: hypothetical protein VGS16_03670 [Candidatus Dormibacteraeota bacterium]|nr:hypothetical protein [Candidatus Dormibacteraeota bacterium]
MDRERQRMRDQFLGSVVILIIQFLLGMAVNLFVTIPRDHPGANPPEYFTGVAQSVTWAILHGHVLLILHASLGLILVLNSAVLLVGAIRMRARNLITVTAFGAFGVLAAGFNRGSYLNYHEDFSSMIMASLFAVAVVAYGVGLYVMGRPASA